jgi:hypothetical protein
VATGTNPWLNEDLRDEGRIIMPFPADDELDGSAFKGDEVEEVFPS